MRAAVASGPGYELDLRTVTLRRPGEGEVVVRLDASAACITDTLGLNGNSMAPWPYITGHSANGVVEEAGPNVQRVRVGDRVVVVGSSQCGHCWFCARGDFSFCDDLFAGMVPPRSIGALDDGTPVFVEAGVGTYCEQMIYRESNLVAVHSDLPPEQLALFGCGVMSGVGAVLEVGQVQQGDTVAVVGCGHLGLWMIQAAKLAGASQIIAVEPIAARRELAGRLGATDLIDPGDDPVDDPVDRVKQLTGGRGVDVALEAGGTVSAMEQSFLMARVAGTVVPTSMVSRDAVVTLPNYEYAISAKKVHSCQTGGGNFVRNVPRFIRMVESGALQIEPIISATYPLGRINDAVQAMRDRSVITGVVLNNG
jgi:S-(hydroxymethyl)glutathione dehydrogenase/alcohol dehydrogenase